MIGEIIAGILLGPSAMGLAYACPTGSSAPTTRYPNGAPCDERNPTLVLFPTHTPYQGGPNNIRNYLNVCAQLGVVVFMFVVGLEVDVVKLKRTSGLASLIALFSVALPFFLGAFALGPHLYDSHNNVDGKRVPPLSFKLFVGTSMSVTAFPVLARIITEKGLHHLNIGALAVACAALTDVVAWALLAVVLAVQESQADGGALEYKPVLVQLALIVVYIFVQFIVISPLMRFTVLRAFLKRSSLSANRLAWVLICMLLSAWLMHVIGFHAVRAPARAIAARLRVLTSARYPFCPFCIRRCWALLSSASRFRAAARPRFCTPFSPRLSPLQSAYCCRSSSSSPACPSTSRS